MRINELMDWLALVFHWSFKILTSMGNGFNALIILAMAVLGIVWIKKMNDFNKEAENNGTLK